MKPREIFTTTAALILILISGISIFWKPIVWSLMFIMPILFVGISDIIQTKHILHRLGPNNLVSYKELYPETI
ncbi:hypothetical protein [Flavobacterium soyangense]|uniref:Uncharacterized protein n=1 Tax=Flavobacterium soyangense TaxID=2023265 RepID=A0A930Y001_9FLAO|nr:hypothetical protein [Flavobacterium soyangense]MBF2709443.1 hypothetical protein [Flavobacterium soyangense]